MPITRNSHYVPCMYLKRFLGPHRHLFVYRLLVSRPQVPLWKECKESAIAYQRDLYTRLVLGQETDEVEAWLNKEFETPAEEAIERVIQNEELKSEHWFVLVRFLASQIVRTPAYFLKMQPFWHQTIGKVLTDTFEDVKRKLETAKETGKPAHFDSHPRGAKFPMRMDREEVPEQGIVRYTAEIPIGREFWLYEIRRQLNSTLDAFHSHHWSIVHAAANTDFITSDDPVLYFNVGADQKINFDAGWGIRGTQVLFPLSPRHLLYTQIGQYASPRGLFLTSSETHWFRKVIALHAHRSIFARAGDREVPSLRPRVVNDELVKQERVLWNSWDEEQKKLDARLNMPIDG